MRPDESSPITVKEHFFMLLLLAVFFAFGLFDHDLWGPNDSREGAMINEMLRDGVWVTPMINGHPYLEKPPLLHWTGVALCKAAGFVTEGMLRLPAALYGFGTVLLIWAFARRMGHERVGMTAAFMCATAIQFFEYSKVVLTDISLVFMVMLSFYLFWRAYTAKRLAFFIYAAFYIVSALSFYAKGLLGPGFIWASVVVFLLVRRKWEDAVIFPILWLPVFLIALVPWAWFLFKAGGWRHLETVFWANQVGRFLTFSDPTLPADPYFVHKEPVYYYLASLPVSLLPWTLLVIPALVFWLRPKTHPRQDWAVFITCALLVMTAILHASSAKAGCYTLPLFPFIFLITAYWLEDLAHRWPLRGSQEGPRNRVRPTFETVPVVVTFWLLAALVLIVAAGFVIMLALPDTLFARWGQDGNPLLRVPVETRWLQGCLGLLTFFLALRTCQKVRMCDGGEIRVRSFMRLPKLYAAFLVLIGMMITPAYDYARTYKPLALMARAEAHAGRAMALAFSEERYVGGFTFYLDRRLPVFGSSRELRIFLDHPKQPTGVIVKTKDLEKLMSALQDFPVRVVASPHRGYKAREFQLILHDPPKGVSPSI